jgi:hypothetical protein
MGNAKRTINDGVLFFQKKEVSANPDSKMQQYVRQSVEG